MLTVMDTIEFRCDANPRKLFARLLVRERPKVSDGNLLEFACRECRAVLRERGDAVAVVLHRFDAAGDLVETVVEPPAGAGE
jgi:hypothetical protein